MNIDSHTPLDIEIVLKKDQEFISKKLMIKELNDQLLKQIADSM
jgi:hypothetical protein